MVRRKYSSQSTSKLPRTQSTRSSIDDDDDAIATPCILAVGVLLTYAASLNVPLIKLYQIHVLESTKQDASFRSRDSDWRRPKYGKPRREDVDSSLTCSAGNGNRANPLPSIPW